MEPSTPRVINTDNFEVGIHDDNKTGWFYHHKYGDEFGGGLWFENNKLTDYDGISDFLPDEVIEAIINFGFVVTDEFLDKDKKMSEKQKETNSIIEELEKFNPVGTKILVEFEISKDNGYIELMACLMDSKKATDLEDFIGVKINKIYHKDVTIPDDDVQTLLERVLDKIKKHKADGYSI